MASGFDGLSCDDLHFLMKLFTRVVFLEIVIVQIQLKLTIGNFIPLLVFAVVLVFILNSIIGQMDKKIR